MIEHLRFHLDECLTPKIARAARQRGIDITDSHSEEMLGYPDTRQWDFCQKAGKVLITADSDFLEISNENPDHYVIVFCLETRIGSIIRKLEVLSSDVSREEMRGRIDYIR